MYNSGNRGQNPRLNSLFIACPVTGVASVEEPDRPLRSEVVKCAMIER